MTSEQKKFIEQIAGYVKKYAPQYGVKCYSAIIAQAICESGWGKSSLSAKYHKTKAQICLRFLLQRDICILPRTNSEERLKENIDLFDFELHRQLFAEIAHNADLTVIPMKYAQTSKLDIYKILQFLKSFRVKHIVGFLSDVNIKHYNKVTL